MTHLCASTHDAEKIILGPFDHISQKGVERDNLMAGMWRALNLWYDCPKEKRVKMAVLLDDAWSVSYLMDDIVDNGILRRAMPTAHLVYGLPLTIYGTLYSAIEALDKVFEFEEHKAKLSDGYIKMCLEILENQTMILYHRNNYICPTYEQFAEYLSSKAWIPFCSQLLQLYGKNKYPDIPYSLELKIGMFVQVYNDYLNLQSKKYFKVRFFCEDVTEGKFSFVATHAVLTYPEDKRVLEILKQRSSDIEVKKRYVNILKELGSLEYAKTTLKKLTDDICAELIQFFGTRNVYMEKPFKDVVHSLENDDAIYMDVCTKYE